MQAVPTSGAKDDEHLLRILECQPHLARDLEMEQVGGRRCVECDERGQAQHCICARGSSVVALIEASVMFASTSSTGVAPSSGIAFPILLTQH